MLDFHKSARMALGGWSNQVLSQHTEICFAQCLFSRQKRKKKMTETTPVYNNTIHYLTETAPQICALPCTHQLLGLVLLLSFVSWVEANVAAICHSRRYRGRTQQWDTELCSTPKTTTASETFSSNWTQLWRAEKCVELSSFHIIT